MKTTEIATENDLSEIISLDEIVVVKYGAEWCSPCNQLDKVIDSIENLEDVTVVKVDCDKFEELSINAGIKSMPTTHLYMKGKLVSEKIGYMNASEFISFVID